MTGCRVYVVALPIAWACATAGFAADRPAGVTDETRKQAEATYRDVFGTTHDQLLKSGKPAEKSEFAKKLTERAKQSAADPALVEVLQKHALTFAQADKVGVEVALDIHRTNLAVPARRLGAVEKYAEALERSVSFEPPANRGKVGGEVVKAYRTAAAELERVGQPTAAMAAVGKARAALRKYTPAARDVAAALDADDKRLQPLVAEQAEADRLKQVIAKNPTDAKARAALGCILLKRTGTAEAAAQFASAGGDWAALAATLGDKSLPAEQVGRAVARVAEFLPADDKRHQLVLLDFARKQFETARYDDAAHWEKLLPDYAHTLEKQLSVESATGQTRLAPVLVRTHLELAQLQYERNQDVTAITTSLQKAKASLRQLRMDDLKVATADVEAADKLVRSLVALEADVAKWTAARKQGKLDARGHASLGAALLRVGNKVGAADAFAAASTGLRELARMLGRDDIPHNELGDAYRGAAAEFAGDESTVLLTCAGEAYSAFLDSGRGTAAERARVELVVRDLPRRPSLYEVPGGIDLLAPPAKLLQLFAEKGTGPGKLELVAGPEHRVWKVDVEYRDLAGANWKYKVVEKPTRPDEIRYVGFSWRRDKGTDMRVYFRRADGRYRGYRHSPTPDGDEFQLWLGSDVPRRWTRVVRDLYEDFGSHEFVGLGFGSNDMTPTELAGLFVGKTEDQVRWSLAKTPRD